MSGTENITYHYLTIFNRSAIGLQADRTRVFLSMWLDTRRHQALGFHPRWRVLNRSFRRQNIRQRQYRFLCLIRTLQIKSHFSKKKLYIISVLSVFGCANSDLSAYLHFGSSTSIRPAVRPSTGNTFATYLLPAPASTT